MPDWILDSLSDEQQKPLSGNTQNTCILASAGSGKTNTLVHLIAKDLSDGIDPSEIIAFTFTEKAADELLARIYLLVRKMLPNIDLSGMYIGTIHGWCFQFLLEKSEFYNFTPLDELHMDVLISRLYDKLGLERTYGLSYPHGVTKFLNDLNLFYNENLGFDDIPPHVRDCVRTFIETTKDNHLLTYGDMIRYSIIQLHLDGAVPGLKQLYVDEYQDVNPAQVVLIKAMVHPSTRITVVGDDMQCIYQWRGSDVRRIIDFPSEFTNTAVYQLSSNYRSKASIVQLANAVAATVVLKNPKKPMIPERDDAGSLSVAWMSVSSIDEQAKSIADIVTAYKNSGVPLSCIAVLLRSVFGSGRPIVDELKARNLDVECPLLNRGGEFLNEFIITLFNWLRKEHLSPKSQEEELEIETEASAIWRAAQRWIGAGVAEEEFWLALEPWSKAIDDRKNDAYDIRNQLYNFLDACNIRVAPSDSDLMVGLGLATQIIRSVEEIHRRRLDGEARKSTRQIMAETYFALVRNQETFGESIPINTNANGVLITTVHQAKGLEWPIVIVPSLIERKFPVSQKSHGTSFNDSVAYRYGTTIEDERRLFYVAVTRARERLFLLDYSLNSEKKKSRFLEELSTSIHLVHRNLTELDPSIWSLSPADIVAKDRPPLRIGLSDILLYLECPYQYGLRRVAGIQPSVGDELGFGKGLHEIIQRWSESGKSWSEKQLKTEVAKHVSLPYMSRDMETRLQRVAFDRVKKLNTLGMIDSDVETEVPIELVLNQGIISGTVDYLRKNEDGTRSIIDWKSNIHEKFLPRYEKQLQVYAYTFNESGLKVKEAQLIDVGASSESGKLVAFNVDLKPDVLKELVTTLDLAIFGISDGNFGEMPSERTCSCCDMYRTCLVRFNGIKSK